MTDNELKTKFVVEGDESAKKKLLTGLAEIEGQQKKLAAAVTKGSIEYAKGTKELDDLGKQKTQLVKIGQALTSEFAQEAKALGLLGGKADEAIQSFNDLYEQKRRAAEESGGDFFGGTASGAASLRGGAEALGLGQVAAPLAVVEGLSDIAESTKLLGAQASALGASAAQAIPGLTGSAAGLVAVGVAALPIAAIVGAAGLAIHQYNKAAQEQARVLESVIDANRAVRQDIAAGLTSDGAESRLQELTAARAAEAETLSSLQGAYSQFETELQDSLGIFSGPVLAGIKAFDAREEALVTNITASNDALRTMDAEIVALQRALANSSLASADAAQSVEQLKQAETELSTERAQATQELTASLDRISQANEQIATQTADRARREAETLEVESLQRAFALEDEQAEQAQHWQTIATIAGDGRKRIETIQGDLSKLATERTAKISEITSKGDKQIQKLSADFMAKQIADSKRFSVESRRIAQDRDTAITRIAESGLRAQEEAQRGNSVIDFLKVQEQNAIDLKHAAADGRTEEQRRAEDRALQIQQEAEAYRQRTTETITQIESEKQTAIQAIEERRQMLVASIETERQAIVDKTNAAIAAEDAQQAKEQQTADRQAQLAALRDKHEEDAFQRTITAIEQRRNAELAVYTELQNRITTIGAAIRTNLQMQTNNQQLANGQQNRSSSTSATNTSSQSTGGIFSQALQASASNAYKIGSNSLKIGNNATSFANEGIVKEPTVALIGDRPGYHEALLNFKPSEGLPATLANRGLSGGGGNPVIVNVTMPVTVGDVASKSYVTGEIAEAVTVVLKDGIGALLLGAIYPNG